MCLLALHFLTVPHAPIVIAANREERYDRPSAPPALRGDDSKVMCGLDEEAGGAWFGVNDRRLVIAVTNRPKSNVPGVPGAPEAPRSRGLLCRDLLDCKSAEQAASMAFGEVVSDRYAGANYLCVDERCAIVVHGGDHVEAVQLSAGLHLLTNGDINDETDDRIVLARQLFDRAGPAGSISDAVAQARSVCTDERLIKHEELGGTVSSEIVALAHASEDSCYLFAAGRPVCDQYADLSDELRTLLTDQSS